MLGSRRLAAVRLLRCGRRRFRRWPPDRARVLKPSTLRLVVSLVVPLKTPRSERTIPPPKVAADALAAHLTAHPTNDPIGCDCPKTVTCSRSRSGLLFRTLTGRPDASREAGTAQKRPQ